MVAIFNPEWISAPESFVVTVTRDRENVSALDERLRQEYWHEGK